MPSPKFMATLRATLEAGKAGPSCVPPKGRVYRWEGSCCGGSAIPSGPRKIVRALGLDLDALM